MDTKIAVLTHGWVVVGLVEDQQENGTLHFIRSKVIRRWGTTKGIGQLARGPLPDTLTDLIDAPSRIEGHAVLFTIDATGWVWDGEGASR